MYLISSMFGLLFFETIIVPKGTESIQLLPFLGKLFFLETMIVHGLFWPSSNVELHMRRT